jgi:predicted nuclease of predicted toxin-antitoxin system
MYKFKLDENLPAGLVDDLRQAGHDATSIFAEGMSGTKDPQVLARCQAEGRILITLDLDFSDIRAYPPDQHLGIIVLRPDSQAVPDIRRLLAKLLPALKTEAIEHRLWIVEESRLRIRGGN